MKLIRLNLERINLKRSDQDDSEKDYEYSRANLYSLVEKGQEAVNGILELAQESDSARAYEVAATTIKAVADTTDKLIDLQQKMKDLEKDPNKGPLLMLQTHYL